MSPPAHHTFTNKQANILCMSSSGNNIIITNNKLLLLLLRIISRFMQMSTSSAHKGVCVPIMTACRELWPQELDDDNKQQQPESTPSSSTTTTTTRNAISCTLPLAAICSYNYLNQLQHLVMHSRNNQQHQQRKKKITR